MLEMRSHDCSPRHLLHMKLPIPSNPQKSEPRAAQERSAVSSGKLAVQCGADVAVINHGETDGQIDERTGRRSRSAADGR